MRSCQGHFLESNRPVVLLTEAMAQPAGIAIVTGERCSAHLDSRMKFLGLFATGGDSFRAKRVGEVAVSAVRGRSSCTRGTSRGGN